ncbi:hypothetical protein KEM55_008959 [Ascosphaera atra]|nr:hypothetical protein KEM55_008959 [Ascosphaera atra]
MEVLQSPPQSSTFIPLAQHQSQTPASFYDIPPVLHYHASQCRLVAPARELRKLPGLKHGAGEGAGQEEEEGKDVVVEGVDVWVTSEYVRFYFFFASSSSGLAVPYPSISLHAVQRLSLPDSNEQVPGLYMQLILNTNHNATDADDDDEMLDESDT